ncbi:glycosyltransferase family 4 protein [Parapedobacter pyrenivorans]|uniref:glycosyltransferase family 4 protein n=1 Tax=Parapedobacter pyrenivorans TaxID=1305674 RepID=UPI00333F52A9
MSNSSGPQSILFFTSSSARTGSEVLLFSLLTGLDRDTVTPYVYSFKKGELLAELPGDIPYYLPYSKEKKWWKRVWRSVLKGLNIDPVVYQLRALQRSVKAAIWYVNTIVVDERVLTLGQQLGVRIVTHFHELSNAYRFIRKDHLKLILRHSEVCIGCSNIVCEKIRDMGHENVLLQYSFIDESAIDQQLENGEISREELGISPEVFVWVISGTVTYEKGLDYLPQILTALERENCCILWLGRINEDGLYHYVQSVVQKRWPGKVIFTGELKERYYQFIKLGDGLLMPSREDSFSLVMLEAAYLGKPIVSFNSGGVNEFVNEARGIVVDSWNATDLAEGMKKVMARRLNNDSISHDFEFTKWKQLVHFHNLIRTIGPAQI